MLLDAYMEFRDIHRVLSTYIAGVKAGTMEFDRTMSPSSSQREGTSPKEDKFAPTACGLAKAKLECTTQMMKIIEAVETLGMPHTQSKKEDFPETTFENVTDFRDRLPAVRTKEKMELAVASMPMAVGQPEQSCFPAGVWDTIHIHDWRNPMQRTEDLINYDNGSSEQPLPSIWTGLKKIDAFGGANLRFDSNTESVTASSFAIGLEQWSDSIVYEGDLSWVGIPPNLRGVQAGSLTLRRPTTQRRITFARPFGTPPQVLVWLSGLDLRVKDGKEVFVEASAVSTDSFMVSAYGLNNSINHAKISWIAVDQASPCLTGSFAVEIEDYADAEGDCAFPAGKFSATPTVLTAFSAFEVGGEQWTNTRFGVATWGENEAGFCWKVYKWCDSSIRYATIDWIAIPAQ
ncbi:hypothetical protein SLS54_010141 [Diplodia seriata]